MFQRLVLSAVVVFSSVGVSRADDWAGKMFKVRSVDFGEVARNAKTEFAFEFENPYAVDLHIAGVKASCGCTTPIVEKDTVTTYEKGVIRAHYNTDRFSGKRGATLTVTFDRPRYAEVQLTVAGYIRTDVTVEPSGISLGQVDAGAPATNTARVTFFEGHNPQILDFESKSEHVDVEVKSVGPRIYEVRASLKPTAPVGFLSEAVTLKTNSKSMPTISLLVEGQVTAPVSVSPGALYLGVVRPGQQAKKNLIVKGKAPFRIRSVTSGDSRFTFDSKQEPNKLHVIPLTFTADAKSGKIVETIQIETDASDATLTCVVSAAVVEGVAVNK